MMRRGRLILLFLVFLLAVVSVSAAVENSTTHVRILNTAPVVVSVVVLPDPSEVGVSILNITANITDVNLVPEDIANVNVTLDMGTVSTLDDITLSMIYDAGLGIYINQTYQVPAGSTLGIWNASVIAEDNAGATATNFTTFTVQDTIVPIVTVNSPPYNTTFIINSTVNLTVNVTDNGSISSVIGQFLCPAPTGEVNITLAYNSTSGLYEGIFNNTQTTGQCNITVFVTDTGNNSGNTTSIIQVGDVINPTIVSVTDSPDPVDPGLVINISANLTDNIEVATVIVEVDLGNGTKINYSMALGTGTTTNGIWDTQAVDTFLAPGAYNYTVYATDTSGNMATPLSSNFTVNTLVNINLVNVPIEFGNTTIPITDRRADNGTAGLGYPGVTIKGFPAIVNDTGNVNVNVTIKGTNLTGQTNSAFQIDVTQVQYNLSSAGPQTNLTTADTFLTNLTAFTTTTQNVYFWISIPLGYIPQEYNGTITFTAVQI